MRIAILAALGMSLTGIGVAQTPALDAAGRLEHGFGQAAVYDGAKDASGSVLVTAQGTSDKIKQSLSLSSAKNKSSRPVENDDDIPPFSKEEKRDIVSGAVGGLIGAGAWIWAGLALGAAVGWTLLGAAFVGAGCALLGAGIARGVRRLVKAWRGR